MKYAISSRQPKEYLEKAKIIKVEYRDREQIFDLAKELEQKSFELLCPENVDVDWATVLKLEKYCVDCGHGHLILRVSDLSTAQAACKANLLSYWAYPITSFYELQGLLETYNSFSSGAAPAYIILGAPLTHRLPDLQKTLKNVLGCFPRMVANKANTDGLIHKDGVCGSWIRPEDVAVYQDFGISALDFVDCDLKKEQALFRIYAEEKAWPGDLGLIISDLNYLGTNRMLDTSITSQRAICGQKCQNGGLCRICYRILDLANPALIRDYQDSTL